MVLVNIPQAGVVEIADENIVGSKTIENFLQYASSNPNVVIPLSVNYNDWQQYLQFLNIVHGSNNGHNEVKIGALVIIDYLDNLQQAAKWCELYRSELQHNEIHNHNIIKSTMVYIINKYTQFIPNDVLPFDLLDDFNGILTRLNKDYNGKPVPINGTYNIVDTLYSPNIAKTYYDIIRSRSTHTMTNKYIDNVNNMKFILQEDIFTAVNNDSVLYDNNNDYYNNNHYGMYVYKL